MIHPEMGMSGNEELSRVKTTPRSLLYEGVGDGLHAVGGADEDDGRASTHHEPQVARFVGQLEGVVGVADVLRRPVQDQIQKWVEAFKYPRRLPPARKLDTNCLIQIF